MDTLRKAIEAYWVSYYLIYVGFFGSFVWERNWKFWQLDVAVLADIFNASVGIALASVIIVEAAGRMVLLIPAAVRKIMEEGRKEGRKEGREEGRKNQRKRFNEAVQLYGREENGVRVLRITPDVERFLSGDSDESPS
jgi:hypothetical protein